MMSIERVKSELFRFFEEDAVQILMLSGAWGVGKTWAWNQYLGEARSERILGDVKVLYISLFGIESLPELKATIFSRFIISSKNEEQNLTRKRASKFVPKLVELFSGNSDMGQGLLAASTDEFIRDAIICFDDIERKSDSLKLRDFLGFASNLRDRQNCKVALILNEKEMPEKEEFEVLHEKVIDTHLEFDPSTAECLAAVAEAMEPKWAYLAECVEKLKINNIRIIHRILRLANRLSTILDDVDSRVLNQAVHTLVFLVWAKYDAKSENISAELVRKKANHMFFGMQKREDLPEDEQKAAAIIQEYSFRAFDEFDEVIANGVDDGFFEEEKVVGHGRQIEKQFLASDKDQSFHDVWSLYHKSLDDNETEFVTSLLESFKANFKVISPLNAGGTANILRDLGYVTEAEQIVDYYISNRDEGSKFFDLSSNPFGDDITDEYFLRRMAEKASETDEILEPVEVLQKIVRSSSWNPADTACLAALSTDDFVDLFKSHQGEDLHPIIKTAISFATMNPENEQWTSIGSNAIGAIKRIAAESKYNKRRLARHGIALD